MKLKLISAPASAPVSVNELKDHLRIETNEEDVLLSDYIDAATELAEGETGNKFVFQTWEIALNSFDSEIELPLRPLSSISSITYIDQDGVEQTLSPLIYKVDDYSFRPRITLAWQQSWPSVRNEENAIKIRGVFGKSIPEKRIQQAIQLICGEWYDNREDAQVAKMNTIPHGAKRLLMIDANRQF